MRSKIGFLNPGFVPKQVVATPPSSGAAISFTGTGTFVESPAGTWGGGPANLLGNQSLAVSQNGLLTADYNGDTNRLAIIGWDSSNTVNDETNWPLGIFVKDTGVYYYVANGSGVNTAIPAAAGDKYGIRRLGGSVPSYTAEYLRGGVWTILFTYAAFAGVDALLYSKAQLGGSAIALLNPTLTLL